MNFADMNRADINTPETNNATSPETTWWERLKAHGADALSLALPISCAGCALLDRNLCSHCRSALRIQHTDLQYRELWDQESARRLPLWFAMEFVPPVSSVLHEFKERGRTSVARYLAQPLRQAMKAAYEHSKTSAVPVAWVVPPSSRASFRQRGYSPISMLVRTAGIRPKKLLRINRRRADQSTLGRSERFHNMKGVYSAVPQAQGRHVILVDDVITTGATLLECARALRAGGADVLGAAVLAYTPKSSQDTRR